MSTSVVSPVFVGRQEEIASLTALLDRVQRSEPAFALIGGEAGVGKTRLLGELAAQAGRAGFTVLLGHCIELGAEGLPLAPLVDALRALTRAIPADELAQVVGPAAPGLARLLPELSPDPPARRGHPVRPAAGTGTRPARPAQRRPVLLVLEDLHWADQSTPGAGRLPGPLAAGGPGAAGGHLRLVGADIMCSLIYGAQTVLLLLVSRSLEMGAHGYGYLFAGIGAGALAGTALAGRVQRCGHPRFALAAALAAVGLPMPLLAIAHWPAIAIALVAATGAGAVLVEIMTETGLQRMLDEDVFGRAYGLALPASLAGIVAGSPVTTQPATELEPASVLVALP